MPAASGASSQVRYDRGYWHVLSPHFCVDAFLTFFEVIAIIPFILIKLPIVYFDNLRADTVEEITVVRHHEQAEIGTAEIFFKPFGHIQIKVVGRLIKNQQVRFGNQGVSKATRFNCPPESCFTFWSKLRILS